MLSPRFGSNPVGGEPEISLIHVSRVPSGPNSTKRSETRCNGARDAPGHSRVCLGDGSFPIAVAHTSQGGANY